MQSPTTPTPISGPPVEVPLVFQYFHYLIAQLNIIADIDQRTVFEQWLVKAKKSTGGSVLGRHAPTQPVTFPLVPPRPSAFHSTNNATSEPSPQQQTPLFLAQERSVCDFVKLLVKLLSEAGFSISSESAIPANSAAIITDQAQAIKTLQRSFHEQENMFNAQAQMLEAQLRQLQSNASAASFSHTGGLDGTLASSGQLLQTPDFSRNASVMSTSAAGSVAGGGGGESAELKLFAAKQEIAKLKNTNIVTQKDLTQAQRHITELTQRVKENDDTIASLEIAFAALKTVHKNEKDDLERVDAMKETGSDAMVARLAKLTAMQGEQLLIAEENRSRTQRNHMEELDRILMAHQTLIAHLEEEIQHLRTSVATMSQRNTELLAQQLDITGRQANALAGLMKNNVEIVEKQYRPSNLVIHMTAEDRARKEVGQQRSSTSALALATMPHDARWDRSRLNGTDRLRQLSTSSTSEPYSARGSASCKASIATEGNVASLVAAIRQFPLPTRPPSSSSPRGSGAASRPRPQSSSLHRR